MARSNLPFVSSNIPPDLRQFLERVRESLDGDTYVRRTDYLAGRVPRYPGDPDDPNDPPDPPRPCGKPVTPTAPTGLTVAPGFSGFLLSWDMPSYCGHDRTEVFALRRDGSASELTDLNMLGESKGVMYSHVCDKPDDYWCFWIRHVNVDDVEGPFNGTGGTCARTAIRPDVILDTLKGQITSTQLYRDLSTRIELIDVTEPLSQLTLLAAVTGRVIRSATEPTNATVDPDLQAGDIWIETDAYYPGTSINKAYRYSGTAWLLLPATSPNQLSAAVLNEATVRATEDSIEASKREGLFAGAFAGIGNAYQYFIQETAPTATKIGDIWAWRNPQTDAAAIFKRWNGSAWTVVTPQTTPLANANVDANRRAAKYLGMATAKDGNQQPVPPAAPDGGYVIGDQLLVRIAKDTLNNQILVYTAKAAPATWVLVTDKAQMLAAAMVYQEQYVRVDEDQNVLAEATELVYATAGDSRPNLCPNALFEEGMSVMGNPGGFTVATGAFGVRANWADAPASGGYVVTYPRFPITAGDWYGVTGDARMTLTSGSGNLGYRLAFYSAATGGAPLQTTSGGKVYVGGAYPLAVEFSDDQSRRQALWFWGQAPGGASWAEVQFIYVTSSAPVRVSFRQATAVRCETAPKVGDPAPKFTYDSSSALVGDIATARIGYCTKRIKGGSEASWQTTADKTKQDCTSGTHGDETTYEYRWNQGLPWSQAVKQVYVTTTDKCYLNGTLQDGYDKNSCETNKGTWVPGDTAALEQRFQAIQNVNGILSAQYTVKIDIDGHVSGFGLSTDKPIDGNPTSQFGVRADRFFVTGPSHAAETAPAVLYDGRAWYRPSLGKTYYYWSNTRVHPLSRSYENPRGCYYAAGWKDPAVVNYTGTPVEAGKPCPALSGTSFASFPLIVQASDIPAHCSDPAYTTKATCEAAGKTWFLNVPKGTYIESAYIQDAVITGAQIAYATIDDAHITNLTASKIKAGSIAVGECIQSAQWYNKDNGIPQWRICGDGSALFNDVTIRTTLMGGSATGLTTGGAGYYLDQAGNARFGAYASDASANYVLWDQTEGALKVNGTIRGGAATARDVGIGYYLGSGGAFRVGDPAGANMLWDQNAGTLTLTGHAKSAQWDGAFNASGGIDSSKRGTKGWAIAANGDAVFRTIHLQKNTATKVIVGTNTTDTTEIAQGNARDVSYVPLSADDIAADMSGLIFVGTIQLVLTTPDAESGIKTTTINGTQFAFPAYNGSNYVRLRVVRRLPTPPYTVVVSDGNVWLPYLGFNGSVHKFGGQLTTFDFEGDAVDIVADKYYLEVTNNYVYDPANLNRKPYGKIAFTNLQFFTLVAKR